MKGVVVEINKTDGKLSDEDIKKFLSGFSFLQNGKYFVRIEKSRGKRTLQQNNLFWLYVGCLADQCGWSKDSMKMYLCSRFCKKKYNYPNKETGELMETEAVCSTTELNTKEFATMIENIRMFAQDKLGVILPSPEDEIFEFFEKTYNYEI